MSEWQQKRLKDIVDIRVSNVDKKIYPNKSLVKLCNYMDAYSNDYITSKISFSTGSADTNEIQRFGLKINDVMITKDSETPEDIAVSSVVIEELENVVCGYHLAILRPVNDELDGKFLMLKLKQPELKNYFYSVANGSTRYGLTIGNIENAKIQYPALSEQQQIAQILSTCDAVIEKTQAAIEKYKAIKQGLLHDLFTRGIDVATGKHRPKYEDAPELYKESKLGWIPLEWEVDALESVCDVTSSKRIYMNEYVDYGIPFYRSLEIILKSNNEEIGATLYISTDRYKDIEKHFGVPRYGDILITSVGTLGVSYRVQKDDLFYFKDGNLIWFRNFNNIEYSRFLLHSLDTLIRLQFDRITIGTSQKAFTIDKLKKLSIFLPKENEYKIISERIEIFNIQLQTEQTYLHKLQQIKAGLMSDLLSGKKRVKLSEEEEINA